MRKLDLIIHSTSRILTILGLPSMGFVKHTTLFVLNIPSLPVIFVFQTLTKSINPASPMTGTVAVMFRISKTVLEQEYRLKRPCNLS